MVHSVFSYENICEWNFHVAGILLMFTISQEFKKGLMCYMCSRSESSSVHQTLVTSV